MQQVNEEGLASYLDVMLARKYPHMLSRYTQGVITAVAGSYPMKTVSVQRVGEQQPDGHDYLCPLAWYYPQPGDPVELVWRDEQLGYVAYPLAPSAMLGTEITLATIKVGNPDNVVGIDSIPQDLTNLRIIGQARSDYTTYEPVSLNFNDDVGADYAWSEDWSVGATLGGANSSGATTSILISEIPAAASSAGDAASFDISIPNYTETAFQRTAHAVTFEPRAGGDVLLRHGGHWSPPSGQSSALRSLKLTLPNGRFVTGSQFTFKASR